MKPSDLQRLWQERRDSLRKIADGLNEAELGARASPGTMSVAEHILHVLSAEKTAIEAFTTTPGIWEWRTGIDAQSYPGKAGVVAAIEQQSAKAKQYFAGLTEDKLAERVRLPWGSEPTLEGFWVQWFLHEAHHCGSAVSALRACGTQPPEIW